MNRQHLSEQANRIRREELRSPVENAFAAFAALTDDQRQEVADRFNATFDKCVPSKKLVYCIGGAA